MPLYALQSVLALLAGGTLFDAGRERIEKLLERMGLYRNYGSRKLLLISAAACGLLLVARLSLPYVAVYYNNWGTRALLKNDLTAATLHYQRAIRLNPDYAEAHYSLASIYDRTQRYDEAISEYKTALQLKDQFGPPRNNLARLYLLRGSDRRDFEHALTLINQELERSPTDELFRYSLYKNLGWANYKLENYPRAEDSLRQAILLRDKGDEDQGAAAHCLLGYVLEAQNKPGAADEWDYCVTYARGQQDVEAVWLEYARMKLQGGTPR
jgi:tetratricopeptide (TPR) repeat protein